MAETVTRVVVEIAAKGNAKQALDDTARAAKGAGQEAAVAAKEIERATAAAASGRGGAVRATLSPAGQKAFDAEIARQNKAVDGAGAVQPQRAAALSPVPARGGDGLSAGVGILQSVGGGAGGMLAAAGPTGAVILAAIGALQATASGVEALGRAATILGNTSLDSAQKTEKLAESIPLIGGVFKSLREGVEGLQGIPERLRQLGVAFTLRETEQAVRGEGQLAAQAAEATALGARARAGALAAAPRVGFGFAGGAGQVFTAAEERELSRAERRVPLELAKRTADAEVVASRETLEAAKKEAALRKTASEDAVAKAKEVVEARKKFLEQEREEAPAPEGKIVGGGVLGTAAVALAPVTGGLSIPAAAALGVGGVQERGDAKVAREVGAQAAIEAQQKAQQAIREREAAEARLSQAQQQAAQAESASRKANLALARENLAVLKEELSLAKSRAQSFGSMTVAEQSAALAIAQRFQQGGGGVEGLKRLTPEEIGVLQRAGGGEQIQQAQQQLAQQSQLFRDFQTALGIKPQDIGDLQRKIVEANVAVTAEIQIDEEKLGESIAKNLEAVVERLAKLLDVKIAVAIQQVEARFQKQAAGQ